MSNQKGLRVLLTGATGYIGKNLAKRLSAEKYEVHAIVREDSDLRGLLEFLSPRVIHLYDGSTESIRNIVDITNPDVVFHLASLFISEHQPDNILNLVNSNILLTTQLLEAMKECNVHNLVNTGTSWQHFHSKEYNPVNLYSATKEAAENIIRFYEVAFQMKVIHLKLYDTYGPCDPRKKILPLIMGAIEKGELLKMSPGEQLIDLVYIDDVIECYILAMNALIDRESNAAGVYGISSCDPIPLKDLVEMIFKFANRSTKIEWGARPYRKREVMMPWVSKQLPGWKPKVRLEDGLRKMFKDGEQT